MPLEDMIRLLSPPLFVSLAKRLRSNQPTDTLGLFGDYNSWAEAMDASTGYDNDIILEKTKTALLKVKAGEAAYERDSVLFEEVQYTWPLLAGLMWVAARCEGTLNVLDFGGSLGSTYFQNKFFLSALPFVRWNIVEQLRHVEIGKTYFEDEKLRFFVNTSECLANTQPNVVILSSVLQYLENPYNILDQILKLTCVAIIIDRTPFWTGETDRLCVQNVPPSIYPASYPSWIFSKQRFDAHLVEDWKCIATFDNPDKLIGPVDFSYQGAIIARKNAVS